MATTRTTSPFRVGDQVQIDLGRRKLVGEIVEDRGALGVNGRRIFQVQFPMDPLEPLTWEVPEDEIVPVAKSKPTAIPRNRIIEYLTEGGLVSILQANSKGGKNQPRVWLCYDQLRNVTHTFQENRGVIGGDTVPFDACRGVRIFKPKVGDVVSYLKHSFRLTDVEAKRIVDHVGTEPR